VNERPALSHQYTGVISRYLRAFSSTTAAFRRSPLDFARFIGDFRSAALHCFCFSVRISHAA
jgi:hypothetical protein